MGRLGVFNFITLNGFYKGLNEDTSWHRHGDEEEKFSEEGVASESIILFGRVTYELMASFWPTENAIKMMPVVAEGMNKAEKIVFSRTLKKADWNNTRIIKDNMIEEVKKMKKTSGKDLTILGSGNITTQLAEHDLIDDYQIMIDPVAIGNGTSIFKGIGHKLDLELVDTRTFKSGVVLLNYRPLKK